MTTPEQNPAQDEAPAKKPGLFARMFAGPKKALVTTGQFGKELWNDHQFWVNALAVKGGAAAIIAGGAVVFSFAYTFPFLVTAGLILVSGAAIAVGALGILAGADKIRDKLKETWYKARKLPMPPPKPRGKSLGEKLKEKPFVQKILAHRWTQKFMEGRTYKTLKKLKDKQDALLGTLAVGGSLAYTVVGGVLLVTQIAALPVIAVPTLVTVGIIGALSYVASGIGGLWLSGRSIVEKVRASRLLKKNAAAEAALAASGPDIAPPEDLAATKASPGNAAKQDFEAVAKPANDDKVQNAPALKADPILRK